MKTYTFPSSTTDYELNGERKNGRDERVPEDDLFRIQFGFRRCGYACTGWEYSNTRIYHDIHVNEIVVLASGLIIVHKYVVN